MSTIAKPQQTPAPAPRPVTSNRPLSGVRPEREQSFLFDKENYMWMIGGVVLIFLGLILLSGGKSADPHQFNYAEIYSFRRLTLAPLVMLLGFGVEVYAIMKKPKETAQPARNENS
jgi:hypothetical protein